MLLPSPGPQRHSEGFEQALDASDRCVAATEDHEVEQRKNTHPEQGESDESQSAERRDVSEHLITP